MIAMVPTDDEDDSPFMSSTHSENAQTMRPPPHSAFHNTAPAPTYEIDETSTSFEPVEIESGLAPAAEMGSDVNKEFSIWSTCMGCFTIEGYRRNFDVNTEDIKRRIVGSIIFFNVPDGFRNRMLNGKNPDAYGPLWVTMTLVFFLSVTSNVSAYFKSDQDFEYDIAHLIRAMIVLFSFSFGLPILFYGVLRCVSVQMTLAELVSLYGYCLVPYLPITILCIIPDEIAIWLFLSAATIVSLVFLLRNVASIVLSRGQERAGPILSCMIGCHVILLLVLKIGFYHHHHHKD